MTTGRSLPHLTSRHNAFRRLAEGVLRAILGDKEFRIDIFDYKKCSEPDAHDETDAGFKHMTVWMDARATIYIPTEDKCESFVFDGMAITLTDQKTWGIRSAGSVYRISDNHQVTYRTELFKSPKVRHWHVLCRQIGGMIESDDVFHHIELCI